MCVFPRREHDVEGQQRLSVDQKPVQEALGRVFFASCFLSSFWVAFRLHFGGILAPQMEPKNVKNLKKARSKTEIIPKRVQDASQGGPGEILGEVWKEFWEDLGGLLGGRGANSAASGAPNST